MPRRYSPRRRNAKRRQYRRKRRGNRNNVMGYVAGLPKTTFTHMRYATSFTLTSTLGLKDEYKFRCIGPYDPDITSIGHQPMNYNLFETLYDKIMVVGSKLELRILSPDAAMNGVVLCYISDDSSVPYSNFTGYVEGRRGPYTVVTNQRTPLKLTAKFSSKKWFNVKDLRDNFERIGSGTSTSPVEDPTFNVIFQELEGATKSVTILATLTYACLFSDPKDQPQS